MTSYELNQHMDTVLRAIGIDRVLTKYIFILARGYEHLTSELTELLYSRNRTLFSKKQQNSQDKFIEIRKQSETFPVGLIFHEAIQLKSELERLSGHFKEGTDKVFQDLALQVDQFYKAQEDYARNGDEHYFTMLMAEAKHLYSLISATRQAFSTLRNATMTTEEAKPDQQRFSMWFKYVDTFSTLVLKLGALERLYLEVCKLIRVGSDAYPLQVIKVETGSLWVCVEGHKRAIEMMGSLVERYTLFLYRRLASGEAAAAISDRVLATQSLVNLVDELERTSENGMVVEEAQLQKSALVLRRDLVALVAGEPSVRINEVPLSVDESVWSHFIQESLQLLPRYSPVVVLNEQVG